MELENPSSLPASTLATLSKDVAPLVHLRDIYDWCSSRPTPVMPVLSVSRADLSQDVVIPHPEGLFLAFEVT